VNLADSPAAEQLASAPASEAQGAGGSNAGGTVAVPNAARGEAAAAPRKRRARIQLPDAFCSSP
jgi:hypothetical protein